MSKEMSEKLGPGAGAISVAGLLGLLSVVAVYVAARVTGTDFSVAAPPALYTPIPLWLFAGYSVAAGASMFLIVLLALRTGRPRATAFVLLGLGLGLMTPAPFLVTDDFWTIFWLTASHFALVAPLFVLSARGLPARRR